METAMQLGSDAYEAHVEEMLTIGEGLMGPAVWDNKPWFDNIKAMVPQPIAGSESIAGPLGSDYSLIDQTLADIEAEQWQSQ